MISEIFNLAVEMFNTPITLYGFTFSFFNLFMYVCLALILAYIIGFFMR